MLAPSAHVVVDAEDPDRRGGMDRGRPDLVVEADVPAGDRYAEGRSTAGSSGEPKFRQSVRANGRALVAATFWYTLASSSWEAPRSASR
jgi:hypothetical protein